MAKVKLFANSFALMQNNNTKTLVVIGGGAAGFFCAINAAQLNPNLKVIILEKSGKVLSKVKVSGGGRCNVTHACLDVEQLSKNYPRGERFLKKAFHWFNVQHTIDWFKQRGVQLKTESDGRMFATTNTSQTIIDCFIKEANKYNVEIIMNCSVDDIEKKNDVFEINCNNNIKKLNANFVCVACGGYAKTTMFNWLHKMQHTIENPVPSLFTFNIPNNSVTQLMGIVVENATIKINTTKWQSTGATLITHWGLSGPAILKLSAFAAKDLAQKNYTFIITVNWLGNLQEQDLQKLFKQYRQQLATQKLFAKNVFTLPNRLWHWLLAESNISAEVNFSNITSTQTNVLIKNLTGHQFSIIGKTTFKEEFVTCGGIALQEIDVNTMQSKKVSNLFFAGEILDIDGITGGFNFQNAWTTGFIAAKAISCL